MNKYNKRKNLHQPSTLKEFIKPTLTKGSLKILGGKPLYNRSTIIASELMCSLLFAAS